MVKIQGAKRMWDVRKLQGKNGANSDILKKWYGKHKAIQDREKLEHRISRVQAVFAGYCCAVLPRPNMAEREFSYPKVPQKLPATSHPRRAPKSSSSCRTVAQGLSKRCSGSRASAQIWPAWGYVGQMLVDVRPIRQTTCPKLTESVRTSANFGLIIVDQLWQHLGQVLA